MIENKTNQSDISSKILDQIDSSISALTSLKTEAKKIEKDFDDVAQKSSTSSSKGDIIIESSEVLNTPESSQVSKTSESSQVSNVPDSSSSNIFVKAKEFVADISREVGTKLSSSELFDKTSARKESESSLKEFENDVLKKLNENIQTGSKYLSGGDYNISTPQNSPLKILSDSEDSKETSVSESSPIKSQIDNSKILETVEEFPVSNISKLEVEIFPKSLVENKSEIVPENQAESSDLNQIENVIVSETVRIASEIVKLPSQESDKKLEEIQNVIASETFKIASGVVEIPTQDSDKKPGEIQNYFVETKVFPIGKFVLNIFRICITILNFFL